MSLRERDYQHIWHPFTPHSEEGRQIPIVKGEGTLLFDEDGKSYLDAASSWWVNLHGHAHPFIRERISQQMEKLEHSIFAGFTHEPAVRLAEELKKVLPANQSRVFFSDNGSTAVESALKMAIQHRFNQGDSRQMIVALAGGYHGDTFGSMSMGGRGVFSSPFQPYLFEVEKIPVPAPGIERESIEKFRSLAQSGKVSIFIFEPLVQAASGFLMYSAEALNELLSICEEHDIITIADEVVTGFGRTGKNFAADHLEHAPDIMCLAKGLTGGFLPMAVTTCSDKIYDAFRTSDRQKTFFHGHSYTGNPIGCAAALASLELLLGEECQRSIANILDFLAAMKGRLEEHPLVENCRMTGSIFAFDIKSDEASGYLHSLRDWLYDFFVSHGVLIRPLGNTVCLNPPFCITTEQLEQMQSVIFSALNTLAGSKNS